MSPLYTYVVSELLLSCGLQNVVICSTAEGVCHIFDLQAAVSYNTLIVQSCIYMCGIFPC